VDKKYLVLILLSIIIILSSCSTKTDFVCNKPHIQIGTDCCLDYNHNSICDKDETALEEKEETVGEEPEVSAIIEEESEETKKEVEIFSNELPERTFTIEELGKYISKLVNFTHVFREDNSTKDYDKYVIELKKKDNILLTSNNQHKGWVIELINNPKNNLETTDDFYNYVRADNWKGWRYYVNETRWGWLHKPLTKEELEEIVPNYDYKTRYHTDIYSAWIDHDVYEEVINTSRGKILQYRMEAMLFTPEKEGYWIGNWENAKLIYKIPCCKDIIIYYRPMWRMGFGYTGHVNQKKETAKKNWERDIQGRLPEVIKYSEKIMEFCGINKKMFQNVSFKNYEYHEQLVHNWKVYYATVFNYTFDADIKIKPTDPDNETYEIEFINVTFISYENETYFKSLKLKIELEIYGVKMDYHDIALKSGNTYFGEIIKKSFVPPDRSFKTNTTIILKPYYKYYGAEDVIEAYKYYIGKPLRKKLI